MWHPILHIDDNNDFASDFWFSIINIFMYVTIPFEYAASETGVNY